jgi:hypothetical protein
MCMSRNHRNAYNCTPLQPSIFGTGSRQLKEECHHCVCYDLHAGGVPVVAAGPGRTQARCMPPRTRPPLSLQQSGRRRPCARSGPPALPVLPAPPPPAVPWQETHSDYNHMGMVSAKMSEACKQGSGAAIAPAARRASSACGRGRRHRWRRHRRRGTGCGARPTAVGTAPAAGLDTAHRPAACGAH